MKFKSILTSVFFQIVLLVLKEAHRARNVLKGVEMAASLYSDAWLVMIAIGTAKGNIQVN